MSAKSRSFKSTLCIVTAVCFSVSVICPGALMASDCRKWERSRTFQMLKLVYAYKSGRINLTADERLVIKRQALIRFEAVFEKIASAGLVEEEMQQYYSAFSGQLGENILRVSEIASSGISTEEKVEELVDAFASSCDAILYAAIVAEIVSWFNIIPFASQVADLLFLATVLCYLGII